MKLFLILFSALAMHAGVFDFMDVKKADTAYKENNYTQAINHYEKLLESKQSDDVRYDLANSYYKNADYAKAGELFGQIKDEKLKFKSLHNLGNAQAQQGKIDEAIKSYEEALGVQDDEDTKYNLELLKKLKEEQKNKENQENQDQQNNQDKQEEKDQQDQQNQQDNQQDQDKQQNQQKQQNKQDQNQQQNQKDQQQQNQEQQQDNQAQEQQNEQKPKEEEQKQQQAAQAQEDKEKKEQDEQEQKEQQAAMQKEQQAMPISDNEERKYKKMLNQRGINTLMLPIQTKGEHNEELKPW
jgi:Ca-activated chloride channel family protein